MVAEDRAPLQEVAAGEPPGHPDPWGTLEDAVLAWLAAGAKLLALEDRRDALVDQKVTAVTAAQGNDVRNKWIAVARNLESTIEANDALDEDTRTKLLLALTDAEQKATKHGKAPPEAAPQAPPAPAAPTT